MSKKRIACVLFLMTFVATSYNACSKFHTLDSDYSLSEHSNENSGIPSSFSDNPSAASNNSSSNPNDTVAPTPGGSFSKGWSNEPTGFKNLLDCPMNNLSDCGIKDIYNSSQLVSDSTAPISSSSVLKSTLYPGKATGGSQLNYFHPKNAREVFVGLMWRTNAEWQGRNVCNKMFFVRGPNSNGVFCFGNYAPVNGANPLVFFTNDGVVDNSHTCSLDLGLVCFPNITAGIMHVGQWTKIETYIKASTTNTSRDGIVRWWINGQLAGNYTNINYGSKGFDEWVWTETWDGCGVNGALPCDLSHKNTVNWEHYIDHLYISTPNGN